MGIGNSLYASSGAAFSTGKSRKESKQLWQQGYENDRPGQKDHFTQTALFKLRSVRPEEEISSPPFKKITDRYNFRINTIRLEAIRFREYLQQSIPDSTTYLLFPKHHFW
ncbi:MAG: hypothetical protein A1D16_09170 [Flavihumibacter sp. CACIAM 22H1]|nr:MAG: hypothetical protein A1D16_09170 [Flavihumibacter sp. CACIAM 22H1]